MAISSLALRTTNVTISNACIEWRTTAAVRPKILEISLIQSAATACSYGLGRPQAISIVPVTNTFQVDDTGDPSSIMTGSLAWNTSPTTPLIFMRRWNSTNVIGVGVIWTFPRGLIVLVSSSLVTWNITATVACDISCVADE